jgi:hypothetical protein
MASGGQAGGRKKAIEGKDEGSKGAISKKQPLAKQALINERGQT